MFTPYILICICIAHKPIYTYLYIHTYIYILICICVAHKPFILSTHGAYIHREHVDTHKHTCVGVCSDGGAKAKDYQDLSRPPRIRMSG